MLLILFALINYLKSYHVSFDKSRFSNIFLIIIIVLITLYMSIHLYKCSCRIILLLYTVRCGCYFETSSCSESEVMLNGVFLHLFLLISLSVSYNIYTLMCRKIIYEIDTTTDTAWCRTGEIAPSVILYVCVCNILCYIAMVYTISVVHIGIVRARTATGAAAVLGLSLQSVVIIIHGTIL